MANEYDSQQSDLQNMANLVSGGLDLSKVVVEYQQYLVSQPEVNPDPNNGGNTKVKIRAVAHRDVEGLTTVTYNRLSVDPFRTVAIAGSPTHRLDTYITDPTSKSYVRDVVKNIFKTDKVIKDITTDVEAGTVTVTFDAKFIADNPYSMLEQKDWTFYFTNTTKISTLIEDTQLAGYSFETRQILDMISATQLAGFRRNGLLIEEIMTNTQLAGFGWNTIELPTIITDTQLPGFMLVDGIRYIPDITVDKDLAGLEKVPLDLNLDILDNEDTTIVMQYPIHPMPVDFNIDTDMPGDGIIEMAYVTIDKQTFFTDPENSLDLDDVLDTSDGTIVMEYPNPPLKDRLYLPEYIRNEINLEEVLSGDGIIQMAYVENPESYKNPKYREA